MIPETLSTPEFLKSWSDYLEFRATVICKPWKPKTVTRRLKQMEEWGAVRAVSAMEHSMDNEYHGLVEPGGGGRAGKPEPTIDPAYDNLGTTYDV